MNCKSAVVKTHIINHEAFSSIWLDAVYYQFSEKWIISKLCDSTNCNLQVSHFYEKKKLNIQCESKGDYFLTKASILTVAWILKTLLVDWPHIFIISDISHTSLCWACEPSRVSDV